MRRRDTGGGVHPRAAADGHGPRGPSRSGGDDTPASAAVPAGGAEPAAVRESDLFPLVPSGLLERARDYLLLGRVVRPRRRGDLLAADVEGSEATHAVRVRVARREDGSADFSPRCDCPASRPLCTHVLATLLLWSRAPEAFAPVDAWEEALRRLPADEAAAALAAAAMGEQDPLDALSRAADHPQGDIEPPGRCLERWPAWRAAAVRRGGWPDAAFALATRIAGAPGSPPPAEPPGLAVRQLAWWCTLAAAELPPPALLPWLQHLFALLEADAAAARLPREVGVWLARLALALPEARAAEAHWLARFAAQTPAVRPAFEAEAERLRWEQEVTWRLADPGAEVPSLPALARARRVLAAFADADAELPEC